MILQIIITTGITLLVAAAVGAVAYVVGLAKGFEKAYRQFKCGESDDTQAEEKRKGKGNEV